jgi:hypothetical protein
MPTESGLCAYKNIFGVPGTGLHSYRIMNIAVIDVISTLILAFVIHQFILEGWLDIHCISIWWIIIGCFVVGIISHRLFCVRTTVDKLLFSQ